jgi:hypothetical protein
MVEYEPERIVREEKLVRGSRYEVKWRGHAETSLEPASKVRRLHAFAKALADYQRRCRSDAKEPQATPSKRRRKPAVDAPPQAGRHPKKQRRQLLCKALCAPKVAADIGSATELSCHRWNHPPTCRCHLAGRAAARAGNSTPTKHRDREGSGAVTHGLQEEDGGAGLCCCCYEIPDATHRAMTPCGHLFCVECIGSWLSQRYEAQDPECDYEPPQQRCPVCRASLRSFARTALHGRFEWPATSTRLPKLEVAAAAAAAAQRSGGADQSAPAAATPRDADEEQAMLTEALRLSRLMTDGTAAATPPAPAGEGTAASRLCAPQQPPRHPMGGAGWGGGARPGEGGDTKYAASAAAAAAAAAEGHACGSRGDCGDAVPRPSASPSLPQSSPPQRAAAAAGYRTDDSAAGDAQPATNTATDAAAAAAAEGDHVGARAYSLWLKHVKLQWTQRWRARTISEMDARMSY